MSKSQNKGLKKALGTVHIWAIAVGLVISGEYFGWNYGWGVAGTAGMLISTLIITLLYLTFVFSYTELTASMPDAGGPFAYAARAFGTTGSFMAGFATLVEFVLAAPAIAFALGGYIHFLYPSLDITITATGCYILFTCINLLGIKESAVFTLVVTLLAVAELLIYMGVVAPHFQMENFQKDQFQFGWKGVFSALPFAIWFYLAIEGVAMASEEARDPHRVLPRGYISGIFTLMILALGVMIITGGVTDWKQLSSIDYPLPESIGIVIGRDNSLTKLFAGIGLFGLVASFHSIMIGYSRQIFAQARDGYLPRFLARIHPRTQTPYAALMAGSGIGVVAVLSGTTDKLIILSAIGATVMYIISMVSLFVLRRKFPDIERPFKTPFYPWFPAIALLLSVVALISILWFNWLLGVLFFGAFLTGTMVFQVVKKYRKIT